MYDTPDKDDGDTERMHVIPTGDSFPKAMMSAPEPEEVGTAAELQEGDSFDDGDIPHIRDSIASDALLADDEEQIFKPGEFGPLIMRNQFQRRNTTDIAGAQTLDASFFNSVALNPIEVDSDD